MGSEMCIRDRFVDRATAQLAFVADLDVYHIKVSTGGGFQPPARAVRTAGSSFRCKAVNGPLPGTHTLPPRPAGSRVQTGSCLSQSPRRRHRAPCDRLRGEVTAGPGRLQPFRAMARPASVIRTRKSRAKRRRVIPTSLRNRHCENKSAAAALRRIYRNRGEFRGVGSRCAPLGRRGARVPPGGAVLTRERLIGRRSAHTPSAADAANAPARFGRASGPGRRVQRRTSQNAALRYIATTAAPPSPRLCWSATFAPSTWRLSACPRSCQLSSAH